MFESVINARRSSLKTSPSPVINAHVPRLKAAWRQQRPEFPLLCVEFHHLAGDALIALCYHRPLDRLQTAAEQLGR
jgi:tRNA (uracil-5-)-methyltransferase